MWQIKILDDVSRDGDCVFYNIESTKTHDEDDSAQQNNVDVRVKRQYKDFQWLYHHLSTGNDIGGVIVPPLPNKIGAAQLESRKIMAGLRLRTSVGEEEATALDCRKLEMFLEKIICHPHLSQDSHVEYFLTEQETPERFAFKKGFIGNIARSISDLMHHNYKDREPEFQQHRQAVHDSCIQWKTANQSYSQLIQAQRKAAVAVATFASTVVRSGAEIAGIEDNVGGKVMQSFGECLNFYKAAIDVQSNSDEKTLAITIDYYARYFEEVKDMLYRRTIRMVEYDTALKGHEKAKPKYKESVSREYYVNYWKADAKRKETKRAYEQTTETAKDELKRFNTARVYDLKDTLLKFAEFQLATARDCSAILSSTLVTLKKLSLE